MTQYRHRIHCLYIHKLFNCFFLFLPFPVRGCNLFFPFPAHCRTNLLCIKLVRCLTMADLIHSNTAVIVSVEEMTGDDVSVINAGEYDQIPNGESENARFSMMMAGDVPQTDVGGEKTGEAKTQITKEEETQIAATNSYYRSVAAVIGGWLAVLIKDEVWWRNDLNSVVTGRVLGERERKEIEGGEKPQI